MDLGGHVLIFAHMAMQYYIDTLKALPYPEYLQTPHWQRKRAAKLQQARYRCERCGYPYHLDVHHLSYENRGCEPLAELRVLCRQCHQKEHENGVLLLD
jgi:5-methylcytosine-specific restriction endonuclease McrA